MMDNQQFDDWLQTELEKYQFQGNFIPAQIEGILDQVEHYQSAPSWWRRYWKGGSLGIISLGGLLALLPFLSNTSQENVYKTTDTFQSVIIPDVIPNPISEDGMLITIGSKESKWRIRAIRRMISDRLLNQEIALPESPSLKVPVYPLLKLRPVQIETSGGALSSLVHFPKLNVPVLSEREYKRAIPNKQYFFPQNPRAGFPKTRIQPRPIPGRVRSAPIRSMPMRSQGRRR